jgi:hypothetical protein
MIKKLALLCFALLLSSTSHGQPCSVDAGDAAVDPKKVQYAVQFKGPSNPFWSYVSESPESWSFRVVQNGQQNGKKSSSVPEFETFSVKLPESKQMDLKNDLDFKSRTEFQIKPAKVKEIAEEYRKFFEDYRKKNPARLPSATQQIFQFYISFKSPSENSDEIWLNHHCSIGFGSNRLLITLIDSSKDQKQVDRKIELDVNQPDLSSAEYGSPLPSHFSVEARSGRVEIRGLPVGTFIARLETKSHEQSPIAQLWSPFRACKMTVKQEPDKLWAIAENSCNKL